MIMLYLDADGVILAISGLGDTPPESFAIKQLVPDATKYVVGQNVHAPDLTFTPKPPDLPLEPFILPQAPPVYEPPVPPVVTGWQASELES